MGKIFREPGKGNIQLGLSYTRNIVHLKCAMKQVCPGKGAHAAGSCVAIDDLLGGAEWGWY